MSSRLAETTPKAKARGVRPVRYKLMVVPRCSAKLGRYRLNGSVCDGFLPGSHDL
ncbi:hypothetical protein MGN01_32230 [Methylobacterium gnaphalii]|uniref:Uncharacterized protein n=1 Tax=Methylobacterium gnaphalii TaxID=1010610 RepID=A0A512JN73_9HYPH|nr:hypothetical protein MGN01_32230 [Methylobacterium gnaphalii]GLS47972.1 hypothetical protein GCM10007885_08160 [Methylobacterium gnaphalii]